VQALAKQCPYVTRVLAYPNRTFRPITAPVQLARVAAFARRHLRDPTVELALLPRWDAESLIAVGLIRLSGAATRVAYAEDVTPARSDLNRGYNRFITHPISDSTPRHEVERSLYLLTPFGASPESTSLETWIGQLDRTKSAVLLNRAAGRGLIILGIGAGSDKRRWPSSSFSALGQRLAAAGALVVVVGGQADRRAGMAIWQSSQGNILNLAGDLSLPETAAVMERARLFVGNDSGPMHLAAAVGLPVLELSCHPRNGDPAHPNAPERFGPWGVKHTVLRPPAIPPCRTFCESAVAHCITGVSVDEVERAALDLMSTGV
jgi:ADP-heptose:LPS heptosyltransferase